MGLTGPSWPLRAQLASKVPTCLQLISLANSLFGLAVFSDLTGPKASLNPSPPLGLYCPSGVLCLCTALLGTVLCTAPLGHCTLHCPSDAFALSLKGYCALHFPILGTVLLHCPVGALFSVLRGALPIWGTVFFTTLLRLCSALTFVGCALHCPSSAVLCPAPLHYSLMLCSVLPLWAVLCPSEVLCSALPIWCTVLCTAQLGHCAYALPFWGTALPYPSWALYSALPFWGTALCTASLRHCALHCPSGTLCSALPLGLAALSRPSCLYLGLSALFTGVPPPILRATHFSWESSSPF